MDAVEEVCTMQRPVDYLADEHPPALPALCPYAGRRATFHGVVGAVARLRTRLGYRHLICVRDLTDGAGAPVFDHYWLPFGRRFAALDLQPGERIAVSLQVDRQLDGEYTLRLATHVARR